MALTINYTSKVIEVPQADLTLITGTLYELDTDQFRRDVMAILAAENHVWMPDAFNHNTEVTVAGTTFARTLEFINGYSVEFEDGAYSVRLAGSNNNIFDVENGILVQNTVQVIPQNSGGLISTSADLATEVASEVMSQVVEAEGSITLQQALSVVLSALAGTTEGDMTIFKDPSGTSTRITGTVAANDRTSVTLTPSS